ncbi:hypothetical protein LOTGIDRAFT_210320 [Lottia gigantea]|uniref:Growth hormone-inducible transmembrane protein n=1 Tax=Lottia gigantea TaxID=225164 RepID=V4A7K9_LOTGI|nr:hypothetical protein LOTGIDRAFT_210320 [Lottia gigantea]ESO89281.1 hypothetical protein LOTGIDRAFT_210320 [Lottia gigantea]
MLSTRLVMTTRVPLTAFVSGLGKTPVKSHQVTRIQKYANGTKSGLGTRAKRRSIKDIAMAPAGDSAFSLGQGVVAGSAVFGLGALCYYGLGMSSEVGAIDRAALWPKVVKARIRDTYMYFGGSIALSAISAATLWRSPQAMSLMMRRPMLTFGAQIVGLIGAGMVCRSMEYTGGFSAKHLVWMAYSGIVGTTLAPLAVLGGPLLIRAAWYTAGIVGGLSAVAMCAPSEKFLNMGGPLAIGLGVVFASSIGGMFLPPTTALGAGLYSITMYGGLVLFSAFLLYDTQKIIKKAETHPTYGVRRYDPINGCLGIYMDTINIFIRLAILLSNGGGGRRK